MIVFSILNIPSKLNKEEVKNHIELINLQYNRLYKKGFYWILSTIDKETVICVQNSLRELIFDEIRIKYIHNNKNQILKNMKDKMDKNIYQKDAKYLGINNNYSRNNYKKGKGSDADSDAFSWRKGSGGQNRVSTMVRSPTRKIIIIINIKEVDLILIMTAKNIIIIIKIMEVITVAITTRKLKLIFLI